MADDMHARRLPHYYGVACQVERRQPRWRGLMDMGHLRGHMHRGAAVLLGGAWLASTTNVALEIKIARVGEGGASKFCTGDEGGLPR